MLVFNRSAAEAIIRRGFTHAVVKLLNETRWLCQFQGGALRPLLDVSVHNRALLSLRSFSPYAQASQLHTAYEGVLISISISPR